MLLSRLNSLPAPRLLRHPARTRAAAAMDASAPYDPDNIFAKILDGRIPSYKARAAAGVLLSRAALTPGQLFETEHALAFLDAFPVARGHALLIPKALGCVLRSAASPRLTAAQLCHGV